MVPSTLAKAKLEASTSTLRSQCRVSWHKAQGARASVWAFSRCPSPHSVDGDRVGSRQFHPNRKFESGQRDIGKIKFLRFTPSRKQMTPGDCDELCICNVIATAATNAAIQRHSNNTVDKTGILKQKENANPWKGREKGNREMNTQRTHRKQKELGARS